MSGFVEFGMFQSQEFHGTAFFSEAYTFSAIPAVPQSLWNPQVYYLLHKLSVS
jgi:hypothetical protein